MFRCVPQSIVRITPRLPVMWPGRNPAASPQHGIPLPPGRLLLAGLAALGAAAVLSCAPQLPVEPPPTAVAATTSVVPLERLAGSPLNPFVRATINGKPGLFLVDTGATVTCLDSRFANRLGLEQQSVARARIRTNVTGEIKTARVARMQLGRHTFDPYTAAILELGHLEEGLGGKVDGVIGMNVLRGARFGFTPAPGWFIFGHPGFSAPSVPIEVTNNAMYIDAMIRGVGVRMKIDTGANRTLMSPADFARVAAAGAPVTEERQDLAVDVNGITRNTTVRVLRGSFQAGRLQRDGFVVYQGSGNLLGMDFFREHEIVFDPSQRRAWFEPRGAKARGG